MKPRTKNKKIEDCAVSLEIEVLEADVARTLEEVYDEFMKVASIPGFRPGKVPRDLVKKHYKKEAREEALKALIRDAYSMAVEEHKLKTISLPSITDVIFEEGKPMSFKMKVDLRPDFKLKDYSGIRIKKKNAEVTPQGIEKALENLRLLNAKYISIEDRPLQMGDYAVCDVDCYVGGKPIHKKRENLWISMDKEGLVPELAEKMAGMKKSEERDCEVTLPEKYPNKEAAGKKASYHVKVKEIKERRLPAIDDEFARDLGKDNLEALKKTVEEELRLHSENQARIDMENQLLGRLIEDNVFSVPKSFTARQLHHIVEDAKSRLKEKGFKKEELDSKDKEFEERFKDDAVKRVRLLFILDSIAEKEGIDAEDSEVENSFRAISAQVNQPVDKVKEYYRKEGLIEDLKEKIREEKTISFLLKKVQVAEE